MILQTLMDNKSNYHFAQNTLSTVEYTIDSLYQSIWDKVAEHTVGQMAKEQVKRQVDKICKDFILYTFDKGSEPPIVAAEAQPKSIPMDQWGRFNIDIDQRRSLEPSKRTHTVITMNSNRNRRTTMTMKQSEQLQSALSKVKEDVFVRVVPEDPPEPEEDKLRFAYLTEERLRVQADVEKVKRQAFEMTQKQMQGKLSKDKKPITFDYNGKVMNLGKEGGTKKPLVSMTGMNIKNEGEIVKKVDRKTIESERIEKTNTTMNKRTTNRSEMLGAKIQLEPDGQKDIIQDESQIENGVKVIELRGDKQTVRQNRQKFDQNYLKYRLREFKDYIKERKFKQHSLKLRNIDSPQRPMRSIVQLQSQNLISDGKKKQSVANAEQGRNRRKQNNQSKNSNLNHDLQGNKVFLPQISFNQNQRSSKYFEEINKDKFKKRVKSVKVNNKHLLSSFYYKQQQSSSRSKQSNSIYDGSSININEGVFNNVFEADLQDYYQ